MSHLLATGAYIPSGVENIYGNKAGTIGHFNERALLREHLHLGWQRLIVNRATHMLFIEIAWTILLPLFGVL